MIFLAKKRLVCLWVICMVIAFGNSVAAATLSFNPSMSTIGVGDEFGIEIMVSGLEEIDLGAFDLNFNYQGTLLSFDSYVLGDGLGNIGAGDADDWSYGDIGGGVINLAELSYLDDLSFQPDAFSLATVFFTASSVGTGSLSFSDVELGDEWGDPVAVSLETGSVNVVPVPAAIWLFASGLIGLAGFRRKFRK